MRFLESDETASRRKAALAELDVLDTRPEPDFDDLTFVAAELCATPTALMSLVTTDRQWFKSRRGFMAGETPLNQSVCKYAMPLDDVLVIEDLSADPRTRDNPLVTGSPFMRFYAGAPLRDPDGIPIGSLCVIDAKPRPGGLTPAQREGLKALARQTMAHLTMRRQFIRQAARRESDLAATLEQLDQSRLREELRERFVAILSHDLRNPLSAIISGLNLLEKKPPPERMAYVHSMMRRSAGRMVELIENTLDFARAKLGGGIALTLGEPGALSVALRQVVDEARVAWPDRKIEAYLDVPAPLRCDSARIAQLLSNLLSNALTHGDETAPVKVRASREGDAFALSVHNAGAPIPPDVRANLFKPYARGAHNDMRGLGLGLYIANEIARAHGGALSFESTQDGTRFEFRMPLSLPAAPKAAAAP